MPPLILKTAANPTGQPKEVFDGLQAQRVANRAQFYYDVPAGPFYGYNRPDAEPSRRASDLVLVGNPETIQKWASRKCGRVVDGCHDDDVTGGTGNRPPRTEAGDYEYPGWF